LVIASADGRHIETVSSVLHSTLDVPKTGTAAVVVDALTERLLLGGIDVVDDADATKVLQAAWEASDLDVMHQEANREALIAARSFASVARERDGDRAVVGIESATQAAVHRTQAPPYDVDAYMKIWTDEWTGNKVALLRLPGWDHPLRWGETSVPDPEGSSEHSRWVPDGDPKPTGVNYVQVVELAPRARLLKEPTSEIDRITTSIDVIDLIEGLLVFAGHFGAVPIRYATGLDIPRDPRNPELPLMGPDGKPMIGFKPRADHFWANSSKDAKFGQLEPAGLASFVTWADHAAAVLRRQTKLPSAYFSLDLKSHMSAELLKTDEAPMVRRVNGMGRMGSLNTSYRRLGRFILDIESPSTKGRVAPRWVDPETRIESQQVDQVTKLVSGGMGIAAVAEQVLDWDPEVIQRAVEEGRAAAESADPFTLLDASTRAALKAVPSADSNAAASA
ncbi:MAG: hypothetical protein ACI379_02710, partial [Nocardioides sp.]|uniref:hypothetical protein n=1 Tax=Nocardioides sp. TaxID=35761 RepID=UPI003EFC29E2